MGMVTGTLPILLWFLMLDPRLSSIGIGEMIDLGFRLGCAGWRYRPRWVIWPRREHVLRFARLKVTRIGRGMVGGNFL